MVQTESNGAPLTDYHLPYSFERISRFDRLCAGGGSGYGRRSAGGGAMAAAESAHSGPD